MNDERIAELIRKIQNNADPLSIRLKVVTEQSGMLSADSQPLTSEEVYIQTGSGQRFYDRRFDFGVDGRSHSASYCDGERCANLTFRRDDLELQDMVGIEHSFMRDSKDGLYSAPTPFRYSHVGLTPLAQAFADAKDVGEIEVIGRPCLTFHFPHVRSPKYDHSWVYAFDRETGVPLRLTIYRSPERMNAQIPSVVWEARDLKQLESHHYVERSRYTKYEVKIGTDGRERAEVDLTQDIWIKEVEFDRSYPASTFWPLIQPTAAVFNNIEHRVTPRTVAPPKAGAPIDPIVAYAPPSSGWLGLSSFALGFALLGVAGLIWFRRR